MGTKLIIGKTIIDLPRGAIIPHEGDVLHLKLKGETREKTYTVYLIEHEVDFNMQLPVGTTRITLKEVKPKSGD